MSQRLNSFFSGSPELRKFAQRTQQLAALQRRYQDVTPPTLAGASRVIGYEQHILTLGADNSAVAAKLRHLAPQILLGIQGNGPEVTGILVRVQVRTPVKPSRSGHTLSTSGRQQIADFVATLRESPLKTALRRLIKR